MPLRTLVIFAVNLAMVVSLAGVPGPAVQAQTPPG